MSKDALADVTAALAAAISLLEKTPRARLAAPSDTMFVIMMNDYRKSLERGRQVLKPPSGETIRILPGTNMDGLDKIITEQDAYYGRLPDRLEAIATEIWRYNHMTEAKELRRIAEYLRSPKRTTPQT